MVKKGKGGLPALHSGGSGGFLAIVFRLALSIIASGAIVSQLPPFQNMKLLAAIVLYCHWGRCDL